MSTTRIGLCCCIFSSILANCPSWGRNGSAVQSRGTHRRPEAQQRRTRKPIVHRSRSGKMLVALDAFRAVPCKNIPSKLTTGRIELEHLPCFSFRELRVSECESRSHVGAKQFDGQRDENQVKVQRSKAVNKRTLQSRSFYDS